MGKVTIIGGSGVEDCPQFRDERWRWIDTRYSNGVGDGRVEYKESDNIIFIPRHGRQETVRYGPSRTQYGANVIAAKALGATVVLGVSAVGSLRPDIPVKSLVVPDDSWNDSGRDGNLYGTRIVIHANPAISPFSEPVRQALIIVGKRYLDPSKPHFTELHEKGVYVTIPGDAFGTRVEGAIRAQHAHIVGMTLYPEGEMALQLDLHYACAALPVDVNLDANHEGATLRVMQELSEVVPVFVTETAQHLREFAKNPPKLEQLVGNIIPGSEKGLALIENEYLQQFARGLQRRYCS